MNTELENGQIPRYLRVYHYYRDLILSDSLPAGTRLPSIRKGAAQFQISRTTMETAYLLLAAEGYLIAKPQSGYYVTDIAKARQYSGEKKEKGKKPREAVRYDFVSASVDKESFRFEVWRRYMKSALRQDSRLLSYGEPQGEADFREVLGKYLLEKRNVLCSSEQIVIGAGVQSLLHILCPLVAGRKKVAFYNPGFRQGTAVFEDHGFSLAEDYREEGTGLYYVTPSQMNSMGEVMPVSRRMDLLKYAEEQNILLIEDDYNNEFRYFQKPAPSLQGLSGGRGVVYLGTFSRLLLPSIRMSFMVLPRELLEAYQARRDFYNQTASKAEQIALTQYIRDGHLDRQIRKSRKTWLAKAKAMEQAAEEVLGKDAAVTLQEAGFMVVLDIRTSCTAEELADRLRKKNMRVTPVQSRNGKKTARLILSCSQVPAADYPEAMRLIKEAAKEE